MKIAVITRHAVTNYGSFLQAMATQYVLEKLGHTCEIINYIREDESFFQHEKTILKRKSSWNNNPIKKLIYLAIRQPESIAAGRRFEKAQQQYLKLTKKYTEANQLANDVPVADVYMTGSDQVWGPVENGTYDSSYCLSFTDRKKIAYAASFGHNEMTSDLEEYYKKWLLKYEHIAVREDSAVQILASFGIQADQVLDPTLLLDNTFWNQFVKPIKHKKYILVYQLHNDKSLGRYAQKVAKKKGLRLVRISAFFHQITREGEFIWCPNIGEFLAYIRNAEYLITDSFHGTAFAINFNIPFVEVLPNNKTGTRNVSILRLTGLLDRILQDKENIDLVEKPIDFKKVNQIIECERRKSLGLLSKYLRETNE